MKIEEGKFYRTRDGRKAGPVRKLENADTYTFAASVPHFGDATFTATGDWDITTEDGIDLVTEWTDMEPMPDADEIELGAIDRRLLNLADSPRARFPEPGYEQLAAILQEAHDQAATGKGKERHANRKPFHDQPIIHIGRQHGVGFNTGQATKKTEEAIGMLSRGDPDAAVRELLGAIVYLASAVLLIREPRR